jgi:GTP-sensing pleiotropic transcriptional regulator CodY
MTMLNLLYVFKKLCYPSIIISITIRGARQVAPAAVIEVRNMGMKNRYFWE